VELRLDDKVAVVTGGSRGIGLEIARRFAGAGASVLISSRKEEGLRAAAGSLAGLDGPVAYFVAHVGDAAQARACIADAVERFGRIDILVNNAAANPYFGPMLGIDQGQMTKTVEVNQQGVLSWCQAAWAAGMAEHGGSILNIASVGGLMPEPGIGWYNVTKAAVVHITRQLAWELAPGVRVNALAPGLVRTHFAKALWEEHEERVAAHTPLRRIGEPDDIATAALFLSSEAASWITGHVMVVDGGATCQPSGGVG